jgi:hypothetical protein
MTTVVVVVSLLRGCVVALVLLVDVARVVILTRIVPGRGGRRRFAAVTGVAVGEVDPDEIGDIRHPGLNRSGQGTGDTETTEHEGTRRSSKRNPQERETVPGQRGRCNRQRAIPEEDVKRLIRRRCVDGRAGGSQFVEEGVQGVHVV